MQLPYNLVNTPSEPLSETELEAHLRASTYTRRELTGDVAHSDSNVPALGTNVMRISARTHGVVIEGIARREDARSLPGRAAVQYRDVGVETTGEYDVYPLAQPTPVANDDSASYPWPLSLIFAWFKGSAAAPPPNAGLDKHARPPRRTPAIREAHTTGIMHRPIGPIQMIKLPGSDRPSYPFQGGIDPLKFDYTDCLRELELDRKTAVKEASMPVIKLEGYDDPNYSNPLIEGLESGEITARELNQMLGRG